MKTQGVLLAMAANLMHGTKALHLVPAEINGQAAGSRHESVHRYSGFLYLHQSQGFE